MVIKKVSGRQFDYDKCLECNHPNPVVYKELMRDEVSREVNKEERFKDVEEIEAMSAEERFSYWSAAIFKMYKM